MSNKKQTAVEWYSDKLMEILGDKCLEFTTEQTMANHYAFKQAKAMEKDRITDAFNEGQALIVGGRLIQGQQYYDETYGM
jgi:hypothetical protein